MQWGSNIIVTWQDFWVDSSNLYNVQVSSWYTNIFILFGIFIRLNDGKSELKMGDSVYKEKRGESENELQDG